MNCIEADNEINLAGNRIEVLEKSIDDLMENIAESLNKILIRINSLEKKSNTKISCPKCHPKFDEDGIL